MRTARFCSHTGFILGTLQTQISYSLLALSTDTLAKCPSLPGSLPLGTRGIKASPQALQRYGLHETLPRGYFKNGSEGNLGGKEMSFPQKLARWAVLQLESPLPPTMHERCWSRRGHVPLVQQVTLHSGVRRPLHTSSGLPAKAGGVLWGKFFWHDHTYTRNWTETTKLTVDQSCILKQ